MSPYNSNRPVISRRAFFLLLGYMSACAAAQDDRINFRGQLGFNDLADCASCFFAGFGQCPLLEDEVGCMTDKCLCQSNHLDKGVEFISDSVISKCSDEQDQAAATDFLKSYCAEHGATEVAAPDSSTDGAATQSTNSQTLPTGESSTLATAITTSTMPLRSTKQDNERQAGDSSTETSTSDLQSASTSTSSNKSDNTDAGSSDKSRLDTSQLVGTIVGVLGLIVAVVTLWVTWKMGKLRNPFHR